MSSSKIVSSHNIDPDRCKAGQATKPTACTWHGSHHWCKPCEGWYGVPHTHAHDAQHVLDNARTGCACRPCKTYRDTGELPPWRGERVAPA